MKVTAQTTAPRRLRIGQAGLESVAYGTHGRELTAPDGIEFYALGGAREVWTERKEMG